MRKNKKGSTLIEIVIVIVILGILATLAVPRITGQMRTAEAAEVMNMWGAMRRAAVNCMDMANNSGANCGTWNQLGMTGPTGAKFTYTSTPAAGSVLFKAINAADTSEILCMSVAATTGAVTYTYNKTGSVFAAVMTKAGGTRDATACTATALTAM